MTTLVKRKDPNTTYICEQFVSGNIVSYDGVSDSQGNVIFTDSEVFPPSIADILQQHLDVFYYCLPKVPDDLAVLGPKIIKAFNVFFIFNVKLAQERMHKQWNVVLSLSQRWHWDSYNI